jgi:hypothetical protein
MCNFNFSLKQLYYSLAIKHQVFVGILGIVLVNLIAVTLVITLIVFLLSISAYKDIIGILENQEFDQMSYFGIATEYANIYYSDFFKIYSTELANFRYSLGKLGNLGILNSEFVSKKFPNFLVHSDVMKVEDSNNINRMTYFSKKYTMEELKEDKDFNKELVKINSMVLMIALSQKFYGFSNIEGITKFPLYEKILMLDYEKQVIFSYPDNSLIVNNNLDTKDVLEYVQTQYIHNHQFINYMQKNLNASYFQINQNFKDSIRYLPLFQEKDIYENFFESEKYSAQDVPIKSLSFSNIYKNRLNIREDNYLDNIYSNVFVLSTKSISDLIYDNLASQTGSYDILITDYSYPYNIYTVFQCQKFLYTGNNFNITEIKEFRTLKDCFKGKSDITPIDISSNTKNSDFEKFADIYNLFRETEEFPISKQTNTLLNSIEDKRLIDHLSMKTRSLSLRMLIHNKRYKIRKSYLPLTSYKFFKYFYPITNIKLSFIMKNEGNFINTKNDLFMHSTGNFLLSFVGSLIICYLIIGLVIYFLIKVMAFIDKPLNIIDDALKTISDVDKFNKAKIDLENYIYDQNYNTVIDEFVELITIILDMIEGNMNLKHELTHNEQLKIKMDKEEVNKEIAMVKMNNIIVLENVILEKLENDNFFYEILKISLENEILLDKNVKNCEGFVSLVKSHINKAKKSKLEKLKISNLVYYEDFEPFVIPTFKFNKIFHKEAKMILTKKSTVIDGNINLQNAGNLIKKSSKKILDEIVSSSHSSDDTENEDCNKDCKFDPVYQKKMIKKMMNIKDNYFLSKLKNPKNPLFLAYTKMKTEMKSKNLSEAQKNLITV